MWEVLITLIVIVIIFMLNPLKMVQTTSPTKIDSQTQSEVNQVVNQTQQQVNQAKMLENQERSELNTNQ